MQQGIFTRTYPSTDIDAVFAQMETDKLHYAQLNLSSAGLPSLPEEWPADSISRISDAALRYDIHISALSGTFNMIHSDKDIRRSGCRQFELQCRIASQLGAPIVTLCTGSRNADKWAWHDDNLSSEAWDDLLDSTREILKYAEKYDVILGIETEANNIINTPQRARRYLDSFNSAHLGIIMDGANLFRPGQASMQRRILDEAFDLLGDDIILAHAKDFRDGAKLQFTGPGRGMLDFEYYIQKLCRAHYRGPIIMHGLECCDIGFCRDHLQAILNK